MAIVDKVISGGQTGADKAGLVAAHDLGIKTGGTAPQGWRICLPDGSDGTDPELGEKYGLVQHESREYPPRTKQNVIDSDGTVWIGYDQSPGGKLTAKTCYENGKPLITNPTPAQLRKWISSNNIKILNVAGNRESSDNPDIFDRTYRTIYDALKYDHPTFAISDWHTTLAQGVILPSGKVAIAWMGEDKTVNIYPDFESVAKVQSKQEGRRIRFAGFAPDGYHLTTFRLIRNDDETGISGTGVIAYGAYFPYGAVIEWATEIESIGYYPGGLEQINKLHGHGGKTLIVEDIVSYW